jgi:hypothetical protein
MGPGCADNDCTDIGNECHECESNGNGAQDFFVRHGSHIVDCLTPKLTGGEAVRVECNVRHWRNVAYD